MTVQPEVIRDWYAALQQGGGLTMPSFPRTAEQDYECALQMATVRALNGLGPDPTDVHGEQAMAEVVAALRPLYERARENLGLPSRMSATDPRAPGRR